MVVLTLSKADEVDPGRRVVHSRNEKSRIQKSGRRGPQKDSFKVCRTTGPAYSLQIVPGSADSSMPADGPPISLPYADRPPHFDSNRLDTTMGSSLTAGSPGDLGGECFEVRIAAQCRQIGIIPNEVAREPAGGRLT